MQAISLLFLAAAAYALGSVPFALVAARGRGEADLRNVDAAGASGAYRQYGLKVAITVFALDTLKGVVPVVIAAPFGLGAQVLVACMVIAGHCWPVWFGFRGGQGIAPLVGAGAVIALAPTIIAVAVSFVFMGVHRLLGLGRRLRPVPFAAPPACLLGVGLAYATGGSVKALALVVPMAVVVARGVQVLSTRPGSRGSGDA